MASAVTPYVVPPRGESVVAGRRWDWATLAPFAGAAVLLGILAWPMLRFWIWEYRAPDSYYAHAPLIPVLIALMFRHRRRLLAATPKAPCRAALAFLIPALGMFVWAAKRDAPALMSLTFLLIVWSAVWLALGTRFVRAFAFPLGFVALMAPLPGPLLNDATLRLETLSTHLAGGLLQILTFHNVVQGNTIKMEDFSLFVDVPCSGFRLLLALLTFSAAFADMVEGTRAVRLGLFLAGLPLSLAANALRIALIGIVGECAGGRAAHLFHDGSGTLTVLLGLAALFWLAKGLRCRTFAGWAIF